MIEKKHTPTPWYAQYNGHYWDITTAPEQYSPFLASVFRPENVRDGQANAEHIVRCVNSHDALVSALKAYRDAYDIDNRDRNSHYTAKWVVIQEKADKALRDAGIEVTP